MKKTIVFGDAHKADKWKYRDLLDTARAEGVQQIVFVGDIDNGTHVQDYLNFTRFAGRAGIATGAVLGNHDNAMLQYINGRDERVVTGQYKDKILKGDGQVRQHLRSLPKYLTIDDVVFCHALPEGTPLSGPHGKHMSSTGHRANFSKLWHYSFNTHDDYGRRCFHVGSGMESYDPKVIEDNLKEMATRGQKFMVKGHEHFPKVWSSHRSLDSTNGRIMDPRRGPTYLQKPAIIQVGDFGNGHYALLEYDGRTMAVQFRHI